MHSGSTPRTGSAGEVFGAFLRLGLTSFGGPIAHLGYFHRELVVRRGWVDETQFAQLLALCQFLPGPASSQLGFALGLIRAGWPGACAAFVAFTLPSAALLVAFAHILPAFGNPLGEAVIRGLKIVAVAVVAQGLWLMARRLTPDVPRALIAVAAAALILLTASSLVQLVVIAGGAVLGLLLCRNLREGGAGAVAAGISARTGMVLLLIFAVLLVLAIALSGASPSPAAAAASFYRAGALVFGGGHVVLPLLQDTVVTPGWVSRDEFLAGYGAAQAIPGPLFSIAGFLGARFAGAAGGIAGACIALIAIFLPGLLLVSGALPLWSRIGSHPHAVSALAGINAAVVGLLAAALYDPLWTGSIFSIADFIIALVALALLSTKRISVLIAVTWCVLASVVRTLAF